MRVREILGPWLAPGSLGETCFDLLPLPRYRCVRLPDLGDGLPERGGGVDGQFRAEVFAVTMRGLKFDGDRGVGMRRAEALHVARRGAGGELVDGVEGVASPLSSTSVGLNLPWC